MNVDPTRPSADRPVGVILAGGRSRRMGGGHKALALLAGKPLLQHVIDRLGPQVVHLILSVEQHDPALERFGLPQVPDPTVGSNGPLGGLLAAMENLAAGHDWLLLTPCDAPFLPADLGSRLLREAAARASPGAVARYQGELQPTFSLWHRELLPRLRRAVMQDAIGGFKQYLQQHPLAVVDWPEGDIPPFFNVNTPDDLDQAENLLRVRSSHMSK